MKNAQKIKVLLLLGLSLMSALLLQLPNCFAGTVTIQFKTSTGTPISGVTPQYYASGSWVNFGSSTNSSGIATQSFTTDVSTYFRVVYQGGNVQWTGINSATNPTINVYTTLVTVNLKHYDGSLNTTESGTAEYYNGTWYTVGATSGGSASVEMLPGSYPFHMIYHYYTEQIGPITVSGGLANAPGITQSIDFKTTKVTVTLNNHTGSSPIVGGIASFYTGTWHTIGVTDASGDTVVELLPGSYIFNMNYNFFTQQLSTTTIDSQGGSWTQTVPFQTTLVTLTLMNHTGSAGIGGGLAGFYTGGWHNIGYTKTTGDTAVELLPGGYTFNMNYNHLTQQLPASTVNSGGTWTQTIAFQTTLVSPTLYDHNGPGHGLAGGVAQYYSGGYYNFPGSTNSTGTNLQLELLPGSYNFNMTYNHMTYQTPSMTVGTGPTQEVPFQTTLVSTNIKNCSNALIASGTGTAQYYSGGWWTIGTTTGGTTNIELLQGSYTFNMNFRGVTLQPAALSVTSGPLQDVDFLTTHVTFPSASTSTYSNTSGGTYTSFSPTGGIDLFPATYYFKLNGATSGTSKAISGCTATYTSAPCSTASIASSGSCSPVTLTAPSGGNTYLWNTGATTPTISVTTSGTYSVSVTYDLNCTGTSSGSATASTSVVVNTTPSAVSASNGGTVCSGGTLTLTSSGSGSPTPTYSWTGPNSFTAATQNTSVGSATTAASGDYVVTYSNVCGTATATTTATVLPLYAITATSGANGTVTPSGATNVCSGSSQVYAVTPSGGYHVSDVLVDGASVGAVTSYTFTSVGATHTISASFAPDCVAPSAVVAGNGGAICAGGTLLLTSSGSGSPAPTVSWSGPGSFGSSSANPSISSATTAADGVYTVTYSNTCGSVSASTTATVNALPSITVSSGTNICQGSSTTLTASGGTTYSWSPSTGLSSAAGATVTASGNSSTTYVVTGTDASTGCSNTASVTVGINQLPLGIIDPSNPTTCSNVPVSLAISPASIGNALSFPGTFGNYGTISAPAANLTTSNFTVSAWIYTTSTGEQNILFHGYGCSYWASWYLGIGSGEPDGPVNPNKIVFAFGTPGGYGSPADRIVASTSDVPTNTWTHVAITYDGSMLRMYLNGTLNNSVSASGVPGFNSNNLFVGQDPGCSTGSDPGRLPFSGKLDELQVWNIARSASDIANTYNQLISPTTTGLTGYWRFDEANGNTIYDVTANAGDGTLTGGVSRQIPSTAPMTGSDNSSPVTYTWSPATGLSATSGSSVSANPSSTTRYVVTATNANGCINQSDVTVNVNAAPTISAGSDVTICDGDNTTLNATGGDTYTWSPASGLSCTNCSSPTASPTSTTTYVVTGTITATGCQNTASVQVSVNALPSVSAGSNVTICTGSNTTLGATGATSYVWTPGAGLSCTACEGPVANPTSTTVYTVVGTASSTGCSNKATVQVSVNPLPGITAGSDVTICNGGSTPLTAGGGDTYKWSPASGLSCTDCSNPTANPSSTTTYVVTGTLSSTGCQNTASVQVSVNALPSVSAGSDVTICDGDNTTLSASGATTYTWSPASGLSCTNCSNPTANPTSTTTYIVTGTLSSTGCQNTASVMVSVNSLPIHTDGGSYSYTLTGGGAYCAGGSGVLLAMGTTQSGISYQLYNGSTSVGSPISGTGPTVSFGTFTDAGTYHVVATNTTSGCFVTMPGNPVISITPVPTVDAISGISICNGSTQPEIDFSGTPSGNSYSWSNSNTAIGLDAGGATGTVCATADEGGTLTIAAPAGAVFTSVDFASFGTPTGSCGSFAIGTCNAPNSMSVVQRYLIGNNSASIPANNNTFTDPCYGTLKHLYVKATYTYTGNVPTFAATNSGSSDISGTITVLPTNNGCAGTPGTFDITVNPSATITGISDISVNTEAGTCSATVTYSIATTAATTTSYTFTGATVSSGSGTGSGTTFNKGVTTVTVTAANGCNSVNTTFHVTVTDAELPVAACKTATVYLSSSTPYVTVADIENGSTDNCGVNFSLSTLSGLTTFTCANVGANSVTLNVTDVNGNTNSCTATVIVVDDVLPTAVCKLATVYLSSATPSVGVADIEDGSTDNCGVDFTLSALSGLTTFTCANVGGNTVTLHVTDIHGNSNTCTATVTVVDDVLPTAVCKDATVYLSSSSPSVAVADIENGSTDNCGVDFTLSTLSGLTTFTCANVGANTVTLHVTDIHGNSNTCTSTVTVVDDVLPTAVCKPATVYLSSATPSVGVADIENGSTDNCGVNFSASYLSGTISYTCANVGANTVTLHVQDIHGNWNTCSTTVTVVDDVLPTITAPGTLTINGWCRSVSLTEAGAALGTPTTGDNCGVLSVTNNAPASFPVGSTAVTWTVTDIHSNIATATQIVNVVPAVLVFATSVDNVSCNGGWNGHIDADISGGTTPYSYTWSTGGAGIAFYDDLYFVPAGTYTVSVTDAHSCTLSASYTVTEPTPLTLSATTSNVSCHGGSDGSINTTAGGGTTPYYYTWSNGSHLADPFGLSAGTYILLMNDANGCIKTGSYSITQPSDITIGGTVTNVSCNGGSNGSINSTVSGGTGTYTYSWSNGATTPNVTGLTSGSYTLTITDINGCIKTHTYTVSQPTALTLTATTTNASCFGGSNGSINTTVTGGTTAYTYAWSNGSTAADPTGLSAGSYAVTVTDAHGCTTTGSYTISSPAAFSASVSVYSVTCYGGSNGSISLTVSGGTPGYTYAWSNGATTASPSGLPAGTYNVTFTDANGCHGYGSFPVNQPTAISLSGTVTNVTCHGAATGGVSVTVTGGTPGYTYSWGCGGSGSSISGKAAGTYNVTVTDSKGCSATASYTITQPATSVAASISCSSNVSCYGGSNGSITATSSGGTGTRTYAWSPSGGSAATASALAAGSYTVTVTDANGCTAKASATITQPSAMTASISVTAGSGSYTGGVPSTIYLGYGTLTANLSVTATGGSGFAYTWSSTSGTSNLSNIHIQNPVFTATTAGHYTYLVTVTNSNGCTATASVSICVIDAVDHAHAGKVLLCHSYGCSPSTLSLTPAQVATHLPSHPGDHLGNCSDVCGTSSRMAGNGEEIEVIDGFKMEAFPNPYTNEVHVKVESTLPDNVDILVYDVTGRVRESRTNVPVDNETILGQNLVPGVYFIEARQGGESRKVKVVKY